MHFLVIPRKPIRQLADATEEDQLVSEPKVFEGVCFCLLITSKTFTFKSATGASAAGGQSDRS